jgi:hypothetical protein
MAAATFTTVVSKSTTAYNATLVTQVYTFTSAGDVSLALTNLPAVIQAAGLPYGSAQLVVTSGSAPTSVQLLIGNDNILGNMVTSGPVMTSFPIMVDLTSGINTATPGSSAQILAAMAFVNYNWQIIGAAASSVITITGLLMGTRG